MRILLISRDGIGAWFLLRLMREGHSVDWHLTEKTPRLKRVLKGIVPPPLDQIPDPEPYDLVLFDSTGMGDLADEISKVTPVIGDGKINSRLEDDRLFGIETMELAGIDVPYYETFDSPEKAAAFLEKNSKRFVYKPFTPEGEEQDTATTYVSESAEDMLQNLDGLFEASMGAPFLLQEVVDGTEISTEAYFDGTNFHLHNHTLEEKKFMCGGNGPNTGCSGNLVWLTNGPNRLFQQGLGKLAPFLKQAGYRGMVDLNTIVTPMHAYGLEFTPRFGYDASATIFSLIDSGLGDFLHAIATGNDAENPLRTRGTWAASSRFSIPPYPAFIENEHPRDVPIRGVNLDDAWRSHYLYDAMLDGESLVTAGLNGHIVCPIVSAFTPEGAWDGLAAMEKKIKIPNGQVRTDLKASTMNRLNQAKEMGWL